MAGLNQYQQTAVNTATPIELVIMVYDECLRSLELAEQAFRIETPERIEQIGFHLRHAQDSITELSVALDMEQGGDIAGNLRRLYDFMIHHLSQAGLHQELQAVQEVKVMMTDLREAWSEIARQAPMVQMPDPVATGRAGGWSFSG